MSTSTSDNYMIDHYGTPWCNQCGHKLLVEDDCIQPHEHATTQAEAGVERRVDYFDSEEVREHVREGRHCQQRNTR